MHKSGAEARGHGTPNRLRAWRVSLLRDREGEGEDLPRFDMTQLSRRRYSL